MQRPRHRPLPDAMNEPINRERTVSSVVQASSTPEWRKLAYSFGSLGSALLAQAFSVYILFFYVDTLKGPAIAIGNVMFAYGIWNAINDPLFGLLSDRTRTRWGRRRPYIALGTLPLALAFCFLWRPPFGAAQPVPLVTYFAIAVFLWDGLYTLVILNWTALFPEMFQSLPERSRVSGYRQMFSIIGLILGIALAPLIYETWGWPVMGLLFAVIGGGAIFVSLLGSHERMDRGGAETQPIGLIDSLKFTLVNRSFAFYVAGNFLINLAFTIVQAVLPFYTKYVLHLDKFQTSLLFLAVFGVAFVFMPMWARFTARRGARQAILTASLLFGVILWGFALSRGFLDALAIGALAGTGLAGLMMLPDVLIADVIDEDQLRAGQRREGAYFGIQAFVIRLGISIESVLVTRILDAAGYDPKATIQPDGAVMALRLLMSGLPFVLLVLVAVAFWFYPLHGERLAAVRQALHGRKVPASPIPG